MSNIRSTNIRFNLDNEQHRQAWQLLQDRDKKEYPSYSQAVVDALNHHLKEGDSGGLDWTSLDEHLSGLISKVVEHAVGDVVERMQPSFLAGYMACAGSMNPVLISNHIALPESVRDEGADGTEEMIDEDIDFDFLGQT